MGSNSANISKNIILLPKQKNPLSNRGISLDVINSNYSKSSNYIRNDITRDIPTTDYLSSINTNANTSNNTRLTYNLYSKKNSNNNINRLTIQVNSSNPSHKICCLNINPNKKKLYNNYINDTRPKYHTAENFYRHDKKKKQKENCNRNKYSNINSSIHNECNNSNNITNNNNSNKISEKSSIYINTNYQDYINESIKKIPKSSSSYRNNLNEKNSSKIIQNDIKKIGKFNYKRGSLEKHIMDLQDNITSSNNIMPGLFNSANSMKKELETLKNENEELRIKYNMVNNDNKKDKRLLQIENKNKDEKICNLKIEIQRLNNTINIKDSIINILKYGNNNNYNTNRLKNNYNSDNNSINEIYGENYLNNINSLNSLNITNGNNNNNSNNVSNIILNNN